jgi:predicted ATPase
MELKEEKRDFKIVIIGRSSSGKTTLINELQNRGYLTLGETAREVLEERKDFEATPEENLIRQKEIYLRQLKREDLSRGLFFCDRSLIDGIAYTEHFGVDSSFIDRDLLIGRYDLILELEKRPFILDGVRIEKDESEANIIHEKIREKYLKLGYSLIAIPNFCEERWENARMRADYVEHILYEDGIGEE